MEEPTEVPMVVPVPVPLPAPLPVSRIGIEVDLAKVKAIMDMPPPTTLKQLRNFQGKLQSIRRFVLQLADKVHPL